MPGGGGRRGLWHGSQTEKIEDHGWITDIKISFSESRK